MATALPGCRFVQVLGASSRYSACKPQFIAVIYQRCVCNWADTVPVSLPFGANGSVDCASLTWWRRPVGNVFFGIVTNGRQCAQDLDVLSCCEWRCRGESLRKPGGGGWYTKGPSRMHPHKFLHFRYAMTLTQRTIAAVTILTQCHLSIPSHIEGPTISESRGDNI